MPMLLSENPLLNSDSYKYSHYMQYPEGTQHVYSYFESRKGAYYPRTTFFGLQYFLMKYFAGPIVTQEAIDQAAMVLGIHMGGTPGTFNKAGWEYILHKHGGYLPIEVKALPEGTRVPGSVAMMTVENLDPQNCAWLTNWMETVLTHVWKPSTVGTISGDTRDIMLAALIKTGDPSLLPFKLHDFGFRGASCPEDAGISGLAHLMNFMGTDTVKALGFGVDYYDADLNSLGFSIPASEHSTMTSWGEDHEVDAFANMLKQYPTGLVACVSDSYDLERAIKEYWGGSLKQQVLSRDGVLIVRPDSGEIVQSVLDVHTWLGESFGYTVNDKGYRVLNPKVRMIQGDGCKPRHRGNTISRTIDALIENKWSFDNPAFGMGGGLLTSSDRDTQNVAFKASSVVVNGETRDVYKRPVTDPMKNSKRGRLATVATADGGMETIRQEELGDRIDLLQRVFRYGRVFKASGNFEDIKARAQAK